MIKRVLLAIFLLTAAINAAQAAIVFVPIFIPRPAIVPGAITASYQKIHTVAVISTLGAKLGFLNNHFVAPTSGSRDISNLNLDDEIDARLKQYLSGRFTFVDVPYDRAALAKIPNGPLDSLSSNLPAFLKGLPANTVDALIIVRPDLEMHMPGVGGLGLENGGNFGADAAPVLWANYDVDVVDARTGVLISHAYSRLRLRDKTPASFAGMTVSDSLKVGDDFNLSDAQTRLLRADLSYLIHLSLIETLRELDLGVELPQPGARTMTPIPPDKDPYGAYKNVAVVSALGDRIDVEHLATIFSHQKYDVQAPAWHLDNLAEQRVRAALAKRFNVVEPNVDRAAFAAARVWDDDGKLAPNFPGLNPAPDIDLYVVVVNLDKPVWGRFKTSGVGAFHSQSAEGDIILAFAHYAIVILDAHSMKVLAARSGVASPDRANPDPQSVLDKSLWPVAPATPTPEELARFHDPIVDVLDNSIDETLLQLALLGVIPTEESLPDTVTSTAERQ